ncbi:tetratricopeptide repeat protein [Leptothoe sp. EHU-05/26/07-4]
MSAELEVIVQRVLGNKLSQDEQQALVLAINSGQATLATGDRALALGGNADNAVLVTGDQNIVGDRNIVGDHNIIFQGADAEAIRQYIKPSLVDIPENLPRSGVIQFVGREAELSQIYQQLQESNQAQVFAISGMGGVGKTELALQYAHAYKHLYEGGVCWLQGKGTAIGTQIVQFARSRLQLNPSEDLDILEQVGFCWTYWPEGDVLIIIDDITDYEVIKGYLPAGKPRFKVLLTTRFRLGASIQKITIDSLSEQEALAILETLIGKERVHAEIGDAKAIYQWLGGLPLGLELVGRYLNIKEDLSLVKMLKRLKSKRFKSRAISNPEAEMTATRGVEDAFDLSWEMLETEAQALAYLLSRFAQAPIPWNLVELCLPEEDEEDLEDLRDDQLLKLNMIQRKGSGIYQLHQLVREFLHDKSKSVEQAEDMTQSLCHYLAQVGEKIPESPTRQYLLQVAPTIPHLEEVANSLASLLEDEDLISPFEGLGRYYENQGFYIQAQAWCEQGCAQAKERFGNNHLEVARSLSNLASIYQAQGKYEEAEEIFLQALNLRKQLSGKDDAVCADSLNSLAVLFCRQGRYQEAEKFLKQALEIWKQAYGDEHPHIADALNNLGMLYNDLGKYDDAEPVLLQVLDMRKKLLGSKHPRITTSLNNLACCYNAKEKYDKAEPLFKEALEIAKNIMGEEHPRVAEYHNNLGNLYLAQERFDEAQPVLEQALQLQQKILGEEHPNVAMGIHNLGYLYYLKGQYSDAEGLYNESLEMRKRLLGESHPLVAISFNNLATLYRELKDFEKSRTLYIQAVKILDAQLGIEHPLTIQITTNLNKLADLEASNQDD